MNLDEASIRTDLAQAMQGSARSLERLLLAVQPLIFNLALRMLGRREDALDATQEILLRVATHLSDYRGDSRFSTWVYRIAANALLDEKRAGARRRQERNFTELGLDLDSGIDRAEGLPPPVDSVSPEHRVAVVELALVCTQGMLMALPDAQRLAYVLCEVMDLDGPEAAKVAGVSPAALRQQLARARQAVRDFVEAHCGLVSPRARCVCDRQIQALDEHRVEWLKQRPLSGGANAPALHDALARQGLHDIRHLQSAAQLFRAHPEYTTDTARVSELLARIEATVFGASGSDARHAH
jgi:RNA polymerase sigma factor (sigma-70 family)